MLILEKEITLDELMHIEPVMYFDDMIKCVADIDKGLLAVNAEMLAYTKLDPKNVNRRKELTYAQEETLDYILGDNLYQNDDESIMKWYDAFL